MVDRRTVVEQGLQNFHISAGLFPEQLIFAKRSVFPGFPFLAKFEGFFCLGVSSMSSFQWPGLSLCFSRQTACE